MAGATNTTLGTIKLAGDFIGGHAEAPALRPSGVKADTYNITDKVYVDAQGRITWAKQLPEDFEWPEGSKTEAGIVQIGVLPEGNKSIDVNSNSVISINKATTSDAGVAKLGNGLAKNVGSGATDIVVPDASTSVFGYARPDNNSMQVNNDGVISIDGSWVINQVGPATTTTTGGVKVGEYFAIDGAGDLSVAVPNASTSVKGLMEIGTGLTHDGAVISVPEATSTVKGVFKPIQPNFFIDGDFNKLYLHNCASPYYGNPEGLAGLVAGVSGASMSIDWPTATISCNYNFDDFIVEASTSDKGKAQIGDNIDVNSGVISLPDPTDTIYGPVKVTGRAFKVDGTGRLYWDTEYYANATYGGHVRPDGITIKFSDEPNAVISFDPVDTPVASDSAKGIVQVGSGFNLSSGVISIPNATDTTLGTISPGLGFKIDNGTIAVDYANMPHASSSVAGLVATDYTSQGLNLAVDGTLSGRIADVNCGLMYADNSTFVKLIDGTLSYVVSPASSSYHGTVKLGGGLGEDFDLTVSEDFNNYGKIVAKGAARWTTTSVRYVGGLVKIGTGFTYNSTTGEISLPYATTTTKGIFGAGKGLTTTFSDSTHSILNVESASKTDYGIVQPGSGISINSGTISINTQLSDSTINSTLLFSEAQISDIVEVNSFADFKGYRDYYTGGGTSIFKFYPSSTNINSWTISLFNGAGTIFRSIDTQLDYDISESSTYYIVYKVVNNTNGEPIQVSIGSQQNLSNSVADRRYRVIGASFPVGAVAGDLVVFEITRTIFPVNIAYSGGSYKQLITCKPAKIFK